MADELGADLSAEAGRVRSRPAVDGAPAVLSALAVDVDGSLHDYARRLRAAVDAGVTLSSGSFELDELPEGGAPEWLARISADPVDPAGLPAAVLGGRDRYVQARGEHAWNLQDWLWCFEPGSRQWAWWDITAAGGASALIWLDARGEISYSCEDMRWLGYVAGAVSLAGPMPLPRQVWEGQVSLGGGS